MANLKTTGIYKIQCTINKKVYIGKAHNIIQRWKDHQKDLRAQRHDNKLLQNDFNMYGIDAFQVTVLEVCQPGELHNKEREWVFKYESIQSTKGYNINVPGGNKNVPYSTNLNLTNQPRKPILAINIETGNASLFENTWEVITFFNIRRNRLQQILTHWKNPEYPHTSNRKKRKGWTFVYLENYDPLFDYVKNIKKRKYRVCKFVPKPTASKPLPVMTFNQYLTTVFGLSLDEDFMKVLSDRALTNKKTSDVLIVPVQSLLQFPFTNQTTFLGNTHIVL